VYNDECQTLGVEYREVADKDQRVWLQQQIESRLNRPELAPALRRGILSRLVSQRNSSASCRANTSATSASLSLEGAEALIPLLDTLVEEGAGLGVEEMVMGMAHRGRLNVLAHVLRKPYELILSEFEETYVPQEGESDGDVKYHLGFSCDHRTSQGRSVHLSLSSNPSHLELVNPNY
jgi:2-oxoglutarate dehydrogenase E1 component